ncbi:MAG: hypothetical protein JNK15_04700, partial [Planctomycetes bacterium]|nr:hypothetical protein [Planctomycetota bacterium]
MLRFVPLVPLLVLVACGRPSSGTGAASPPPATPSPGWNDEQVAAEVAIARSGCVRCHAAPTSTNARWAPVAGPALAVAAAWRRTPDGGAFLRQHHGGDAAADLHAYVASLAPASTAAHVVVSPAALERGDRLVRELACQACHAPADFAGLAARTDHATLAAFLQQPDARRPGLVHPPLSHGEAVDIATALLRAQAGAAEVVPG